MAVTAADSTTAPLGSRTRPDTAPVAIWAAQGAAIETADTTSAAANTRAMLAPPRVQRLYGQRCGVTCQICDTRVECGEPRVVRLALHVPVVDLLNDDSNLEERENLV